MEAETDEPEPFEHEHNENENEEDGNVATPSDAGCSIGIAPALVPCKVCSQPISASSSHRCVNCDALVHPFCGKGVDEEGNIIFH